MGKSTTLSKCLTFYNGEVYHKQRRNNLYSIDMKHKRLSVDSNARISRLTTTKTKKFLEAGSLSPQFLETSNFHPNCSNLVRTETHPICQSPAYSKLAHMQLMRPTVPTPIRVSRDIDLCSMTSKKVWSGKASFINDLSHKGPTFHEIFKISKITEN